jgi:hypothetical protein
MRKTPGTLIREHEINTLARYNAEVARGIVHTEEWKIKMAGYQARYNRDEQQRVLAELKASGATVEEAYGGFFIIPARRRRWWRR